MRLLEYQSKELFSSVGIRVPRGYIARSEIDAVDAAGRLGMPVVLKSQVPVGGRGKAGGIVRVEEISNVTNSFRRVINLAIGGTKPQAILVEEVAPYVRELYLSLVLDRGKRRFIAIASAEGGIEIESSKSRRSVDLAGDAISRDKARFLGENLGLVGVSLEDFMDTAVKLSELSSKIEADLAEINPLAALLDGRLLALDAKITVDDSALFRHPELSRYSSSGAMEAEASAKGFAFVELDGSIAVIGNGAGLVLSTLDMLADKGGKPACFLDLGGGASEDRVYAAFELLSRFPRGERILLNIFGGITRCTDVAQAVREAYGKGLIRRPVAARLSGAGQEEAASILQGLPVKVFADFDQALDAILA